MSDIHEAKTSSMAVHMAVHMFLMARSVVPKLFKFSLKFKFSHSNGLKFPLMVILMVVVMVAVTSRTSLLLLINSELLRRFVDVVKTSCDVHYAKCDTVTCSKSIGK
jgi:hypothetical protein